MIRLAFVWMFNFIEYGICIEIDRDWLENEQKWWINYHLIQCSRYDLRLYFNRIIEEKKCIKASSGFLLDLIPSDLLNSLKWFSIYIHILNVFVINERNV